MVLIASNCGQCEGDGYFGDFGPGAYPMPCPKCAGTGMEGIISDETTNKVREMREGLYTRISAATERLKVTSEAFKEGLLAGLAEKPEEAEKHRRKSASLREKLNEFGPDYAPVERDCLRESWERATQMVDPAYRPLVIDKSKQVVGKTYRDNALMEHARLAERLARDKRKIADAMREE